MEQKIFGKFYIIIFIIIILSILTKNYLNLESYSCNCPIAKQFKTIITDFSCLDKLSIPKALTLTNKFTMSIIMDVVDFSDNGGWFKLFNGGTINSTKRTPGVWINQGFLHVRASTSANFNEGDGCWKIEPRLEKGTHYHLVLVYDVQKISVYIDGKLIRTCPTKGIIEPQTDLHLGNSPAGPNIQISISYLPKVLTATEIGQCWLAIKESTTTIANKNS